MGTLPLLLPMVMAMLNINIYHLFGCITVSAPDCYSSSGRIRGEERINLDQWKMFSTCSGKGCLNDVGDPGHKEMELDEYVNTLGT